eukprot:scaffold15861_cov67-Isochrysis_galbana.AAC.1
MPPIPPPTRTSLSRANPTPSPALLRTCNKEVSFGIGSEMGSIVSSETRIDCTPLLTGRSSAAPSEPATADASGGGRPPSPPCIAASTALYPNEHSSDRRTDSGGSGAIPAGGAGSAAMAASAARDSALRNPRSPVPSPPVSSRNGRPSSGANTAGGTSQVPVDTRPPTAPRPAATLPPPGSARRHRQMLSSA